MSIPNYAAGFEGQYKWIPAGTITVQQASLAVGGRDDATVEALADANKVIYELDDGTVGFETRFRTDSTDGGAWVVEIWAERGVDHYVRCGRFTMETGPQLCSVGRFIDTIALDKDKWETIAVESYEYYIGRGRLKTCGYNKFLFIATTLDANKTLYVDIVRKDMPW